MSTSLSLILGWILVLLMLLVATLNLFAAIQGFKTKKLSLRIKKGSYTVEGKVAQRISVYFMVFSIVIFLAFIFIFVLNYSFIPNPFEIYKNQICVYFCK